MVDVRIFVRSVVLKWRTFYKDGKASLGKMKQPQCGCFIQEYVSKVNRPLLTTNDDCLCRVKQYSSFNCYIINQSLPFQPVNLTIAII